MDEEGKSFLGVGEWDVRVDTGFQFKGQKKRLTQFVVGRFLVYVHNFVI